MVFVLDFTLLPHATATAILVLHGRSPAPRVETLLSVGLGSPVPGTATAAASVRQAGEP